MAAASPPYQSNQGRPASVYSFADGRTVGARPPRYPLRRIGDGDEAAAGVPLVSGVQAVRIVIDFLPHAAARRQPHRRP